MRWYYYQAFVVACPARRDHTLVRLYRYAAFTEARRMLPMCILYCHPDSVPGGIYLPVNQNEV